MFNVELSVDGPGGHAVVALRGELDLAGAPGLASHLIAAVAACGPAFTVDLAGLEFIDCGGLAVLARALKWARQSGGDMVLASPQQQVRRVLEITGLIDALSVYPGIDQVVSGARPAARPLSAAALAPADGTLSRMKGFSPARRSCGPSTTSGQAHRYSQGRRC